MKKLIWLVALLATGTASACDICGCSVSGYSLGLLPGSPQHFVGLGYKWRSYETTHLTLFDNEVAQRSTEQYQTMEAWGRYVPHKRVQLFGYVPYQSIYQKLGDDITANSGLGDVMLSAFYAVPIQSDSSCAKANRRLLVGITSKMPTGHFDYANAEGIRYNENLQPGSGSWDAIYHLNYTELHAHWGFLAEASYRRNSQNKDYFRFGHRFNSSLRLFWRKNVKEEDGVIMPFVGGSLDNSGQDYDGYEYNEYSGGTLVMATFGVDAVINHIGIRTTFSLPAYQHLADTQINSKPQLAASILYLF